MKVILTGATGVVGTECIRLALNHPQVTEVVTLSRRPVSVPDGVASDADTKKLQTIILEDFANDYPEDVKAAIKGADACIWNLAVTPTKAKALPVEEVRKVCHDYPLVGLKAMSSVANPEHPFRFIHASGMGAERDQTRSLWMISDYRRMRGAVDSALLEYAAQRKGTVEVQITKPGLIDHSGRSAASRALLSAVPLLSGGTLSLHVSEIAAAELDQALHGFDGVDTMENSDLIRVGRNMLQKWGSERS